MKHFLILLPAFFFLLSFTSGFEAFGQCPSTVGATNTVVDISCFGAGDGSITIRLNTGGTPTNYELFDLNAGDFVPVNVSGDPTSVQRVFDADMRGVTFSNVYSSVFRIHIFKTACAPVLYSGGGGFSVDEPAVLGVTINNVDPDCDPTLGLGNGQIDLTVTGGTAPYSLVWNGPTGIANDTQVTNADLDAGAYTVDITDANGCSLPTQNIPVPVSTQADAGLDDVVCGTVTTLAGNTAGGGETGTWTVIAGTGIFADANNPTTSVSGLSFGTNTFQWTITDNLAICAGTFDQVDINAFQPATVDAGPPQIVCSGSSTAALGGSFGGSATTASWTTGGDGSFVDAQDPNTTYTPGPNDRTAGTVTLTLTTDDPPGICDAVTDNVVITINPVATVDAGAPQAICSGNATAALGGSFGGAASSASWTTNGDGNFTLATNPNTTYTPGPNDRTAGTVTLTLTTNDPDGGGPCVAATDQVIITINAIPTTSAITGDNTVCANHAGDVYFVTNTPTSTYAWTVPTGASITAGQGTNSITVTWGATSGNVSVIETNAASCPGTPVNFAVTVSANPVTSAITGDNTICANHAGDIYSVTNTPTSTYAWTVPAGALITAGQGTNSITVTWGSTSGNVSVTETNAAGCPGAPVNLAVTVSANPTTSAITGDNTICANHAGDIYSVTNTPTSTYAWTVPAGTSITAGQGTNSITVTWGSTSGNVSVTETNAAGCPGTPVNLAVTVSANPTTSAITGDNTICANHVGDIYSVTNTPTSTYAWTVPAGASITAGQGTNSITVTWGSTSGNVSVTETNAAGCPGTPVNLAVTVSANPTTSAITGDNTICANHVGDIYSVTNTPTSTYAWTVPAGASITAGQGTNSITVTWGSTSGNVSVTETNAAGCPGTPVNLSVTVSANPTTSAITGDNTVCENHAGDIYFVTNTPTSTYAWTVPAGASITAGQGTNSITVTWGATSGNVSVIETNAAGCPGTPVNFAVTVSLNPVTSAITGDNTVCENHAGDIYSVTNTPTSTYAWTVPAGALITAGQGTNSITVTWGATSGNVSVTETNAAGCPGTPVNLAVTVSANPTTSAITGDNTVCENHAGDIYSVTNTPTSTYAWTVPAGASITAGQGTNSITVTWGATSGNVSVTETNAAGCPGTPVNFAVTVSASPTTSAITGDNTVCENHAGDIYSVTNTPTSTYAWTVPAGASITAGQGTNSITVTWGSTSGNVSVIETNAGGCPGTPVNLAVTVSLNPVTSAITGDNTICENHAGDIYSVTNTPTSTYAWTVPAGASITAGQGTNSITVTWGSTSGNVSVTETNAAGCPGTPVNFAVTVNANPVTSAITGTSPVCANTTGVTYSVVNTAGSTYVWTITGGTQASGTNTNSITVDWGVAGAGNVQVVETNTSGCGGTAVNLPVTIDTPATVDAGSPQSVCAGGAVTLAGTRGAAASIWSAVPPGDGVFNPSVLVLNPTYTPGLNDIANGSVTLRLATNDPVGPCTAVFDDVVITVINSVNLNLPVAAVAPTVCTGGGTNITVNNSEVGVSYQLRNDSNDSNIGTAVIGTGGMISLPTGALAATTTFNILTTGPGCPAAEQNTKPTVTVSGTINTGLTVTAQAATLCAGSGTNIQVFSSENGVTYQLRNDAGDVNIGSAVAGNGGTINLPSGALAATTTFNVLASNGSCSIELTDLETVTVNTPPNAGLTVGATITPLCAGGTSAITVDLSEVGVSYQLRNDAGDVNIGSPVVGTGATINLSTGALAATTTFNVLATSGVCTPVELTATATVVVTGSINAGLTVTAQATPLCEGSGTNIQVFSSENGVNYQLRDDSNDSNVGGVVVGTGGTIDLPTGNLTATTVFNVLASNGSCSIELTDIETVNVDIAPDQGLTVGVTITPLCAGGTSAVTVDLSEIGVSYQLRNDAGDVNIGTPVAGTGGTISLSTGVLNSTTTFNILASSGVCTPVELTTTPTVTVAGSINAGLSLNPSADPICAGTGTNVQVLNSEAGVNYQLRNDANDALVGTPVAGTGSTINLPTGNLAATTTFNVLASNVTCSIELTNTQTITVSIGPDISLAVSAAPALICTGTSSSITVVGSEVGVSYQLRNNTGNALVGSPVAGTGGNISLPTGNLAANTTFNVFATGASCSAQLTNLATVTIRSVGDPACSGGTNCFAFNVTSVEQRPTCAIQDDGSITFTLTGGSPNYIFTLSDGASFNQSLPGAGPTFAFTNLSPADYTYTIQDAAGNVCSLPYSLPVQTNVVANATGFVNAACFGEAVGQATITVTSGGAAPFFYSLDNGGSWLSFTSPYTITNLAPNGTYSILVADDPLDQCPAQVSVTIGNSNPRIKGVFAVTNASCNGSDGVIDVTSISGGAGGPYTFRIDGVAAPEPFNNLGGGSHIVSMIDNTGCKRDTAITVTFPGFVAYSAPATTIDATCSTKGTIGIFIPNPPGSYEIGFTTDPINQPTNYNAGYYNPATGLVIINNLNGGTYYVWIRTSSTSCPTRFENSPGVYEVVIGGPQQISFEMGCRLADGTLELNNIKASSADPIQFEIFGNGFQQTGSVTPDALAHATIPGFASGDYIVWLKQDQLTFGCTVYSDTLDAPSGALDTISVVKNVSFPETPTGSVHVKIQESGASPYEAWLVETAFRSDTLTAVRNPVTYEVNFTSLAAATYSLFIEDAAGCRKEYSIVLPFDNTIFIPNIFTPNGDEKNETFYVRNLPESGSKLSITNRWGKEVFYSNNYNPTNLWDGGTTPDGVYFYRLQVAGGGTYTGWVEIVRGVKP